MDLDISLIEFKEYCKDNNIDLKEMLEIIFQRELTEEMVNEVCNLELKNFKEIKNEYDILFGRSSQK